MVYKKEGMVLVIVVSVLCCIALASAASVTIKLETDYEDHGYVIQVKNPSSGVIMQKFYGSTGDTGKAREVYFTDLPDLDFTVFLIEEGELVERRDFTFKSTAQDIVLSFIDETPPSQPQNQTNETIEESVPTQQEATPSANESADESAELPPIVENETYDNAALSGNVVQGTTQSQSKNLVFYVIGGVLLIGIIGFVIFRRASQAPLTKSTTPKVVRRIRLAPTPPSQNTLSSLQGSTQSSLPSQPNVNDVEQKLKSAQQELEELKRRDQIRQAQEKYDQARKDLDRLKGSDSPGQ